MQSIKRIFGLLLFISSFSTTLFGQNNNCTIDICNNDACGPVFVSFAPSGNNVFCENSTITLANTSSTKDFDEFYIDWGDGTIDTVLNYDNVTHEYDFQGIDRCETGAIFNQFICFVGAKRCDEGISCNWNSTLVSVRMRPVARIDTPDEICITDPFTPTNSSCNAESYLWEFGDGNTSTEENPSYPFTSPGEYTVKLTVENSCGEHTTSRKIKVVGQPMADFIYPTENLCAPKTVDLFDRANEFSNTVWNITPADTLKWCFTDTVQTLATNDINVRFKQPGEYNITQTARNVCGVEEKTITLTLGQAPLADIDAPPAGCETLSLSAADLSPNFSNDVSEINWTFINGTPSSASGPDFSNVVFQENGKVILRVSNDCGEVSDSVDVLVFQKQQPEITPLPDTICSGSAPITLSANIDGGTWTGPGITPGLEIFDPATLTPGMSYVISYEIGSPGCQSGDQEDIFIAASTTIAIDPPPIFCENSGPEALTANPNGGTWQGAHINAITGVYDPLSAGIGTDTVRYELTDASGCPVMAEVMVTTEAFPELNSLPELDLCVSDQDIDLGSRLNVQASPTGGQFTWEGPGITIPDQGIFNAGQSGLAAGNYTVYFTYRHNACIVTDSALIRLAEPELLMLAPQDTSVCISELMLQLSTNLSGGVWDGPGIDAVTGLIDLKAAGGGPAAYTYEYAAGTTCAQDGQVNIEIIDVGASLMAGPPVAICESTESTYQLTGQSPAGGYWEGEHLNDDQNGIIDLTQIKTDSQYIYRYCLESQVVAGCQDCATRTFILNANPDPGFILDGTACINETFRLLPASTDPSLQCSWDLGNGDTRSDCAPQYTYTTAGNYTIEHLSTNAAGCSASASIDLYITEPPKPGFSIDEREGCAAFELNLNNTSTGDGISSTWYIDGDTIRQEQPGPILLDSITEDTYFRILLEVDNLCGTVPLQDSVLVHPYPTAMIGLNVDDGCSPLIIELANPTVGNPDTFSWDFGNGTTSTDSLPADPVYTTPPDEISTYEITLIASNACGVDTAGRTVTVFPPDVEAFIDLDTSAGCSPFNFQPVSASTPGSFLSWSILASDGSRVGSSNQPNPSFFLEEAGDYTVLLAAARCGADLDTAMITVLPAPEAGFNAPLSVCLGAATYFQNTSSGISGARWDFGDGTISSELNPTHRYDTTGNFTVTLTVFSELNDCPATYSRQIEVTGLPRAHFSLSDSIGCAPLTVEFTNESLQAASYLWGFGHDGHASTQSDPTFTFERSGDFIISLVARDANGCFSDTLYETITVHEPPKSDFAIVNDRFCTGHDSLLLQNLSSVDAGQFIWKINEDRSTQRSPVYWVPDSGPVDIMLTAENAAGCRDSIRQVIEYLPSPEAGFSPDLRAGCPPLSIDFTNTSIHADQYRWIFNDGNTVDITDPIHLFSLPGTYPVTLIAQSNNQCPVDTAQVQIIVYPQPDVNFQYSKRDSCGAPVPVDFTSQTTGATDLAWDFGDGAASAETQPTHSFSVPDIYEVQLTAINEFGCEQSTTQEIVVNGQPRASFELLPAEGCAPFTVSVRNTSREALSFSWYLDDQLVSEEATPSFPATELGSHDLRLIARYGNQCIDILDSTAAIQVYSSPMAAFTAFPNESSMLKGEVRFENESTNADRFLWMLGDGTESTAVDFEYEYDINGPLEVTLIAYQDNNGAFTCVDTVSQVISPEFIGTFYAHNAMTPEYGEDLHRVFKPVGLGIVDYDLIVYAPWGEQVWRTDLLEETRPAGAWDGIYRGKLVPQGVYVWEASVEFANGVRKMYQGELHVIR
ncbi:PKD domain-containing protein [Flavilitoribacter nigricans]|uniref:PKD domain-containing protein n=1 Tax=Flavilitoribacter nigricans (strain ATCC 23147 / DSM 23189 / NBRC 102662 / NCIMB 1420 / SS-2) TaxID=1122177 RepID=A0A2D0N3W5_FLAN2|nr:PKD domain-containing protein [Flavilitoribacter nigricans]PHN03232.1 hypothetical protein CRP01_27955 [Flavilitoribacter nigricans DSM 23189 = NBRC 102662]